MFYIVKRSFPFRRTLFLLSRRKRGRRSVVKVFSLSYKAECVYRRYRIQGVGEREARQLVGERCGIVSFKS